MAAVDVAKAMRKTKKKPLQFLHLVERQKTSEILNKEERVKVALEATVYQPASKAL